MKRQLTGSFFLVLILTAGFRIFNLQADPPSDFSWSGGYFADEGFWSHNARNSLLFGNPVLDDWDARIVSPIFARAQEVMLHLFGTGLVQVRLVAVLTSIILAAAAFLLLRKEYDSQQSFLFAVLVSLNYPMMVLGRQGILDPFAAMLCLLALVLLMRESNVAGFLAGVLFVAACVTKYLIIYTIVPCVYVVWVSKKYMPFAAGILIAGALWFFLNYLPNRDLLSAYSSYYASQQSWEITAILKNIALQPFYLYFVKTPAILCFANLGIWFFLARILFREPSSGDGFSRLEKMCLLWLISGILFFALWRYRPFRYYTSLIPPMVALAVFMVFRMQDVVRSAAAVRSRLLLFAGALLPVFAIAFVLVDRWIGLGIVPSELGIHSLDALLFLCLTLIVLWSVSMGRGKTKYVTLAFIAVLLLSDARNYLTWMLRPQYTALEISRDLQSRAPDGVITGQWAPELCLENGLRVVPVWPGFLNSSDPFNKYGITHVLQWKYSLGGEKFEEWYPEDFGDFRLVTTYKIKNSDLLLFERKSKYSSVGAPFMAPSPIGRERGPNKSR